MPKDTHFLGQMEEVMAYLDGEVTAEKDTRSAAHLQQCEQCQELAADLRSLSQDLASWQVDSAPTPMSAEIVAALDARQAGSSSERRLWRPRRHQDSRLSPYGWALAFGLGAVAVTIFFFSATSTPRSAAPTMNAGGSSRAVATNDRSLSSRNASPPPPAAPSTRSSSNTYTVEGGDHDRLPSAGQAALLLAQPVPAGAQLRLVAPKAPMIVRTAQLTLVVQDFDGARQALDETLKRHGGYVGEMSTQTPEQGERQLTATLRIPAAQLDAALTELKKLGRVESESQNGEEVTSQLVDLDARLDNARKTEQRLTQLLQNRTGKLEDVLSVEQQISSTREEIERMEAERKSLVTKVDFASLTVIVKQEHKAELQLAPPSVGTRLRNAGIDGYRNVIDVVMGLVEFLLSVGPSLLLLGSVIFFPVRWAWRRTHRAHLSESN